MKTKSVAKNFIFNMTLTVSSFLFPLISYPYVSRTIGPTGIGKVDFAAAVVSYFTLFAQLGIPMYGARVCAEVRDDKEELSKKVHELLVINGIMVIFMYISFFTMLFFIKDNTIDKKILILYSANIAFTTLGVDWFYKAIEQFDYITKRALLFKVLSLLMMFLLIRKPDDYFQYAFVLVFATVGSNFLNFYNLRKYIFLHRLSGYNFKQHLKPILILFSASLASSIYSHMDTLMLGIIKTDADVGYYNAALKVKSVLWALMTALSGVLFTRMSYCLEKKDLTGYTNWLERSFSYIFYFGIPTAAFFMVNAREVIVFLAGSEFEEGSGAMFFLAACSFVLGLNYILGIQVLLPMHKESSYTRAVTISIFVNLIFNSILIPGFGCTGAAAATFITESCNCILFYHFGRSALKNIKINNMLKTVVPFTIVSIILIVAIKKYFMDNLFMDLLVSALIFYGVYLLGLVAVKDSTINMIFQFTKEKIRR